MHHADFIYWYVFQASYLLFPVITIYFFKNTIEKVGLALWLYFFFGCLIEMIPHVLLVANNLNYTFSISRYYSIFPGLFYTYALIEIVFKKGWKISMFYTLLLVGILTSISIWDVYSYINIYAESLNIIIALLICIFYLYHYFIRIDEFSVSSIKRIELQFILANVLYKSVYFFIIYSFEFSILKDSAPPFVTLFIILLQLNNAIYYIFSAYIILRVARRGNDGKITFGLNASE